MEMRSDALVAAAHTILAIERLANDGPAQVATAGHVEASPSVANVVAGYSGVTFDVRSMDEDAIDGALARLRSEVETIAADIGLKVDMSLNSISTSVHTDPLLQSFVAEAASDLGLASKELVSGASHDAQHVAKIAPVTMIFVPSIGGVSHHRSEATEPQHLVAGAEVLLDALRLADGRLDA
jgi:acetylornithine deacetylase/succinyl-diaminopimelate desuccinylase-like protein